MTETIYGINAVVMRLRSGGVGIQRLILREGKLSGRLSEVEDLANTIGVPVERVEEASLDRESDISHQGIGLVVDEARMLTEDRLKSLVGDSDHDLLLLVLDGVTDPRNLGACMRSAATFGVDAVIVPKDNSASLTAVATKTASGGASVVPLIQVVNLSRCLEWLKQQNVWVVGTLLDAEQDIQTVDLKGHVAIVMGSEGTGLRKNTIRHCDFLARIPMAIDELGLNVSVAAGISLYEAHRQRQQRS
jgi:23S rRNA (guanosine2251-2'-O)-methyltransferase